jgi:hypothetical protein
MMEAASTSKTFIKFYQTTRRYNSEDRNLHTCRSENLKSYKHGPTWQFYSFPKSDRKTFIFPDIRAILAFEWVITHFHRFFYSLGMSVTEKRLQKHITYKGYWSFAYCFVIETYTKVQRNIPIQTTYISIFNMLKYYENRVSVQLFRQKSSNLIAVARSV